VNALSQLERANDGDEPAEMAYADLPSTATYTSVLRSVGFCPEEAADKKNVKKFLNRILACPIDEQNTLFNAFYERLEGIIDAAIANGRYDQGVLDFRASSITAVSAPQVVYTVPVVGAETLLYKLQLDRGLTFTAALKLLCNRLKLAPDDKTSGFYKSRYANKDGAHAHVLVLEKNESMVTLSRPNTGRSNASVSKWSLKDTYKKVTLTLTPTLTLTLTLTLTFKTSGGCFSQQSRRF